MKIEFINQQCGNCFYGDFRIDFIGAGIKEEIRMGRIIGLSASYRSGISKLFIRGA